MPEGNGEERPRQELTIKGNTNQEGQGWDDLSHEQLIKRFQHVLRHWPEKITEPKSFTPRERGYWTPEEIIRREIDMERTKAYPNKEKHERFTEVLMAWDILAYDRYEIGSPASGDAGGYLSGYYGEYHEPIIKFSDPRQVQLIDALTEVVGIPHQRGQTEFEIPEKLRDYEQWRASNEYQDKRAWFREQEVKARAKRDGR